MLSERLKNMKKATRFTVAFFSAVLLFIIFNSLEYDLLLLGFSKQIQSAIFAISITVLIVKPLYASMMIIGSCIAVVLMAIFYLFGQISLANYLGSIGIGVLTISSLFHLKSLLSNSGNN